MRIARVCPKCRTRNFGDPTWKCPVHGLAQDQENRGDTRKNLDDPWKALGMSRPKGWDGKG